MLSLQDAVVPVLSLPTPAALEDLQGAVLAREAQGKAAEQALDIAGQFHAYLSELQSKIGARSYSELASRLDIGAVGAVVLENVLSSESADFWTKFLLGGLAEGLMIAASRQYIKAWTIETQLVHTKAAWYLSEALWHTSVQMQPEIAAEQRWETIQLLLAPVHDPEIAAPEKAVLIGRIFQMLLMTHLGSLMGDSVE
jgi:hypothetical protein